MDKLLRHFYQLLLVLSCVSMVSALVAISLNMLTRLIDGWSIAGLDGYAGYAIASALFLALPSAFLQGDHIRVSALVDRCSGRWRAALDYWALGLGVALSTYLAWFAVRMVWQSHLFHDVAPTGDATPMWIPQLTMAVGCVGFAVAMVHALVRRWQHGAFLEHAHDKALTAE
jgi:TRAP-type C4-dicarboxylate transport system permease small subunit